jgi:hypothetical protein
MRAPAPAHGNGAAGRDAATPATPAVSAAATAAAAGASAAAAQAGARAPAPPPPSATEFGRSGAAAPPRQAQFQEVPRPPLEARPAGRTPIRLRWWLVALALLWGVWLLAKPSSKKIEHQIDQALALARECKGSEAQSELIALRKSRATPEQLERLQQALNDEAAKCTRRRQRGKAWNEASGAVETALAASSWDKAHTRLQAFTRRWGEDEDTRVLQARIDALRREDAVHRTHPLAVPEGAAEQQGKIQ